MTDLVCSIASMHLHPIPGCTPTAVREALVIENGLELDRDWIVVDASGEMLSERDAPELAQVKTSLRESDLLLRAPGMLALHLSLETVEEPTRVLVRGQAVKAYHMGALAAQWFADFLGRPGARLVRLDPDEPRVPEPDGCVLQANLVLSLADGAQVPETAKTLELQTAQGPVCIELVKPLIRAPLTGSHGESSGAGLLFGFNARVASGVDRLLEVGARGILK